MIDADKVRNKRFSTVKNGCSPSEVTSFLEEIADELENLIKENADNESKIKKLVDKLNQYREDEDAIKNAMIYAQKESNNLISEAKAKAAEMIDSAKAEENRVREQSSAECERIVAEHKAKCLEMIKQQTEGTRQEIIAIQEQYETEKLELDRLRAETTYFKGNLIELYTQQLSLLTQMPEMTDEELDLYERESPAEYYEDEEEYYEDESEYYKEEQQPAQTNDEEERMNRVLNTGSFEPVIPKADPTTLQFGNNTLH